MSYLIKNNEVLAETFETFKSGATVSVAFQTSGNALANSVYAKVSNAKKWKATYENPQHYNSAVLHNETGLYKEFLATKYVDQYEEFLETKYAEAT